MSMSAIERVIPLVGHLPPSIREGLARRMRELTGLGLIGLAGVASAALMTWSVQDPSLSHATSRPIRNILGYAGAIGADLAMQILGLGAIMLVLTVAVWGWRMMTHRPFDREALRLGSWVLCAVLAAGFVSCWPHGGAWPLPTGLGGVVGDALVRAPAVIFGPAGTIYRIVLGAILFAAMAATFLIACGLGAREHDEEHSEIEDDDKPLDEDEEGDRGSVSLGWLFHALMSTKARLVWLCGAAYRSLVSSAPKTKAVAFSRQEPNLGGGRAAPPDLAAIRGRGRRGSARGRGRRGGGGAGRARAAQEGCAEGSCQEILRQVRPSLRLHAGRAEGRRSPAAQQGRAGD